MCVASRSSAKQKWNTSTRERLEQQNTKKKPYVPRQSCWWDKQLQCRIDIWARSFISVHGSGWFCCAFFFCCLSVQPHSYREIQSWNIAQRRILSLLKENKSVLYGPYGLFCKWRNFVFMLYIIRRGSSHMAPDGWWTQLLFKVFVCICKSVKTSLRITAL